MIIVSITGPTMPLALMQLAASAPFADMVEIRLDLISHPDFARFVGLTKRPIIATCRPEWEGGRFSGPEPARLEILMLALRLGAAYIDVELNAGRATVDRCVRKTRGQRVIVSVHKLSRPPVNVRAVYRNLRATGASVIKLAYLAGDSSDIRYAAEFLRFAMADRQKAIAIAMGQPGEASRVLYRKFGGWATYASPEDGCAAAPGQIRASELKDVYRADRLSRTTKVFGVVGNPLQQSKGIYIHNLMFSRASLDAVYCRFLTNNLEEFIKHIAPVLSGFSVTIPFKEKILKYLDKIDPLAERIGAVNTVLRRGGLYFGTNTDAAAALDAIERVARVKGKRVLILGAGGAARAIAFEALKRRATVLLANRTESRSRKLVAELQADANGDRTRQIRMSRLPKEEFDILVNATSVGMVPHTGASPVQGSILKNKLVFDAVYNPPVTRLLKDARNVGARIVRGTEMYVNQAARQFTLYTGVTPDKTMMKRILERQLKSQERK